MIAPRLLIFPTIELKSESYFLEGTGFNEISKNVLPLLE